MTTENRCISEKKNIMNVKTAISVTLLSLFFINCLNNDTSSYYRIIYVDNGGVCVACAQMRKLTRDLVNKRLRQKGYNVRYQIITPKDEYYRQLHKECKVYKKGVALAWIKNEKSRKSWKINVAPINSLTHLPEISLDYMEGEALKIIEAHRGAGK